MLLRESLEDGELGARQIEVRAGLGLEQPSHLARVERDAGERGLADLRRVERAVRLDRRVGVERGALVEARGDVLERRRHLQREGHCQLLLGGLPDLGRYDLARLQLALISGAEAHGRGDLVHRQGLRRDRGDPDR